MAPNKVRELVVAHILTGQKQKDLSKSEAFGIPLAAVKSHWRLFKKKGDMDELVRSGPSRTIRTPELVNTVKATIA